MKKIIIPLVIIIFIIFIGVNLEKNNPIDDTEDTVIVTSFYPLFDVSESITKGRMEVINITPQGLSPHDFDPSPRDIRTINNADIFFYNGSGLEPWAEKIEDIVSSNVKVINTSSFFNLQESSHDYDHDHGHSHGHSHDEKDPHIWLDPLMQREIVDIVLKEIIEIDEEGSEYYKKNAEDLKKALYNLHESYEDGLSDCELNHVVISHASLFYLSERYGFEMITISGISPEEEPSPSKIAEISDTVLSKDIRHILFETTIPKDLAETIANETGAETITFNPLESLSKGDNRNYISIMEENLEILKKAMRCK